VLDTVKSSLRLSSKETRERLEVMLKNVLRIQDLKLPSFEDPEKMPEVNYDFWIIDAFL
jgi:hypothetical protein